MLGPKLTVWAVSLSHVKLIPHELTAVKYAEVFGV